MDEETRLHHEALEQMAATPWEPDEPGNPGWFKPGQSGNPVGRPVIGNSPRVAVSWTIEQDMVEFVRWHAKALGISVSRSANMLLAEVRRLHEENEEVI